MTNDNGVFPPCRGYRESDSEQSVRDSLTVEFMFQQRQVLGDSGFKQYLLNELVEASV